jgi:hypothetical protein
MTPDEIIQEQIDHLRILARMQVPKAIRGGKAELEDFFAIQNQLSDLLPYLAGYSVPEQAPREAPAPLDAARPAPPLRPLYDDEVPPVEEEHVETKVSFPPDPLWASEEQRNYVDDEGNPNF